MYVYYINMINSHIVRQKHLNLLFIISKRNILNNDNSNTNKNNFENRSSKQIYVIKYFEIKNKRN